ncbi:BtrH N-terminal domain-containing protein [Vibrio sp. DW001]|uniref:BtrH N-terminal domain-containing protein n=1 Tax=Vibrio sp. DW001 TaxID=2912315 RepID=UPI0023AF17FC|nr:BtrH N-terminal domain-containing protein [Vibrio sp. DW001]WED27718.1 BtrH N-terminal domain-containing protein [Vibrio sp. DW001]
MNNNTQFKHQHYAHCESGVMSSMLTHHGLPLSEPMVFGLSSALVFAYLPFVKLSGLPLIAYRSMPKSIMKGLQKSIGLKMKLETFSQPTLGTKRLDELLGQGKIVGAQTSVYWLPYFPEEMRFHFNAHNLIVVGKKDSVYQISDPVFEQFVESEEQALQKARFVKGLMAPKGSLYYPTYIPEVIDYHKVIEKSIKKTAKTMLKTPVPIAGLKGMYFLAKHIRQLKSKDDHYATLFLGHIIRMQEEIGTGGAGFRYIYASFLQESSELIHNEILRSASVEMTEIGDEWREFALLIAKAIRPKNKKPIEFDGIAAKLESIAEKEKQLYQLLMRAFND